MKGDVSKRSFKDNCASQKNETYCSLLYYVCDKWLSLS